MGLGPYGRGAVTEREKREGMGRELGTEKNWVSNKTKVHIILSEQRGVKWGKSKQLKESGTTARAGGHKTNQACYSGEKRVAPKLREKRFAVRSNNTATKTKRWANRDGKAQLQTRDLLTAKGEIATRSSEDDSSVV